jgi:hypothetical protein
MHQRRDPGATLAGCPGEYVPFTTQRRRIGGTQEHPTWRQVESKIAVMPKSAPVMIFSGLGKKIR